MENYNKLIVVTMGRNTKPWCNFSGHLKIVFLIYFKHSDEIFINIEDTVTPSLTLINLNVFFPKENPY